jgi:Flp pilus assembly pilin Flp
MQLIVEDTANRFWQVEPAPDGITHCWAGIEVKRAKGGVFVPKARARKVLVRKAGCRIVADLATATAAVSTLEYGIIASILGLVLVGIFHGFGHTLSTLFSHVATSI